MLYTLGDALLTQGDSVARIARALDATVIDVRLAPPDGALSEVALRSLLGDDYRSWSRRMSAARTRTALLALVDDLFDTLASLREEQHLLLLGGPMRPELCARSWLAAEYEIVATLIDAHGHVGDDTAPRDESDNGESTPSNAKENELFRLLPDVAHVLASSDDELAVMLGQRPTRYPTTEDEFEITDVIVAFDGVVELLRSKVPPDVALEQRFFEEAADAFRLGDCWQFHDDVVEQHAFFQGWRRTHRSGFVATSKSTNRAVLHRTAGCHPVGDTDWLPVDTAGPNHARESLTRAKKLCADERAHIEALLRASNIELSECAHCFHRR